MKWIVAGALIICTSIQAEHHNLIADEYYVLAHNFAKENKHEKAREYYKKSLELQPDHFNANVALATWHYEKKESDQAITHYEKRPPITAG